jgi:hypothetical protein
MKMKTKFTLLFIIFLFSSFAYGQMNISKDVLAAAEDGYASYLEKIPADRESLYGFNNREEFAKVKFGKPYLIMILNEDFFNDPELKDKDYLIPSGEWRVPLMIDKEFRALLTVAEVDGTWKVVGFGATSLAKELEGFEKDHPSKQQYGKILRVYQSVSDFILLPSEDDPLSQDVIPLNSAKNSLAENGKSFSSMKLKKALPLIKENIKNK